MRVINGDKNELSAEGIEVRMQIMRGIFSKSRALKYYLSVLADIPLAVIDSFVEENAAKSVHFTEMITKQCAAIHGIPYTNFDQFVKNYHKNNRGPAS
jgi:hypothetical protein